MIVWPKAEDHQEATTLACETPLGTFDHNAKGIVLKGENMVVRLSPPWPSGELGCASMLFMIACICYRGEVILTDEFLGQLPLVN